MKREKFGSRLGFILVSAGCAIGIGNVWKFPYMTGQGGGGMFVLFYILFLYTVYNSVVRLSFHSFVTETQSAYPAYRLRRIQRRKR